MSEFVTPDGEITRAKGESVISVGGGVITNESMVKFSDMVRTNNYRITSVSPFQYMSESINPELGKQTGIFNLDRNTLFSKFWIEDTSLNGYEIIRRECNVCCAQGALYDDDVLINTWTATMRKN